MEAEGNQTTTQTAEETKAPRVINYQAKIRKNVKWDEDVVDNENMGKKKSKSKFYHFLIVF